RNPGARSRRDMDLGGLVNVGPNSKRTAAALCAGPKPRSQDSVARVRLPHGSPALTGFRRIGLVRGVRELGDVVPPRVGNRSESGAGSRGSVDRGWDSGLTRGM